MGSCGIEAAWAGGIRGREVTDRFLPLVPQLLAPQGVCYLVSLSACLQMVYATRLPQSPGHSLTLLVCGLLYLAGGSVRERT